MCVQAGLDGSLGVQGEPHLDYCPLEVLRVRECHIEDAIEKTCACHFLQVFKR
jgi:hypothetical protein